MKTLARRNLRLTALAAAAALFVPVFVGAETYAFRTQPREQIRVVAPVKSGVVVHAGGRAYLGVQLVDITRELRAFYGAPEGAGVLVSRVAEDSPAAAAGFEVGDVITELAGDPVEDAADIVRSVARREADEEVSIGVVRAGAPLTLTATLEERERSHWYPRAFTFALDEMPEVMIRNGEAEEVMREVFERVRERMSEFDFGELAERMSEFDFGELAERLAEAEERLRELERKLEERER